MDPVVRQLYRTIIKAARHHDRNPTLKGLLSLRRSRVYDHNRNEWTQLPATQMSPSEMSLLGALRVDLMQGGDYYVPGQSMAEAVRRRFRSPKQLDVDAAFMLLRLLESNAQASAHSPTQLLVRRLLSSVAAPLLQAAPDDLITGSGLPEFPTLLSEGSALVPMPRPAAEGTVEADIQPGVETGMLLLAHPLLAGQPFRRSIVLVLAHDPERGSMGIVVNRATELRLGDAIKEAPESSEAAANEDATKVFRDCPLFLGGPVSGSLSILHRFKHLQGALPIAGGLYWQGDLAAAAAMVEDGEAAVEDFKFFVGHAGWGKGQLEGEMRGNDWIAAHGDGVSAIAEETGEAIWGAGGDWSMQGMEDAMQGTWQSAMRQLSEEHYELCRIPAGNPVAAFPIL